MIQALTAGFEEPYAFSLFFGNMATFKVPGSDVQGFSYAGYLTSFGTHHIKNNVIIDSNWFEFEAKLKGDDIKTYRKLKWSYRVGARLFGSNEITDYVYVSTLRDRIDFARTGWSLLRNSFLEASLWMKTRPHLETADVIRAFLVVGKNYPFWRNKLTFSLGVGMIVAGSDKYQGCLQVATQTMIDDIRDCRTFADPSDYFEFVPDRKPRTEFQPVIRPNLKF